MGIDIKPVTTIAECRQIEEIICQAWGADLAIAIPDHLTITVAKEPGGVVLLATDGERPVGFCWGFLSFEEPGKRLKHCSHMTGVVPSYRGRQVGEQIKWAQRRAVLDEGIDHMTWTFDPLETLNARLNLSKLGGVCRGYRRDVYGDLRDSLNAGIATDRFYLDWWLASPWVEAHAAGTYQTIGRDAWLEAGAVPVNEPARYEDIGLPDVSRLSRIGEVPALLLQVPRDFQAVKRQDLELAAAWRQFTRRVFEAAFDAGYSAIDLLTGSPFCSYVLAKDFSVEQDGSELARSD